MQLAWVEWLLLRLHLVARASVWCNKWQEATTGMWHEIGVWWADGVKAGLAGAAGVWMLAGAAGWVGGGVGCLD